MGARAEAGTRAGTGARSRTRREIRVERRESLEDKRRWATLTSNQQPQPQALTPQRGRRIMLKTRAQRRRRGTASGRVGERPRSARNLRGVVDPMLDTGENWAER